MAEKKKTTKEILREKLPERTAPSLYNPAALEGLCQEFEQWRSTMVGEEDRKNWCVTPHTILGSEIPREMLYTPLSNPDFDYMQDLGHSGQEPFTRGIHANMYRGREFTMRQLTGFGGPEETNQRIKFMLAHGGTGINVLFDLPTIQMYDSDDPMSRGQVGMSGVAVDSVEDMDLIFKDIPLDRVTVSLVTHYPSNTAILFPMYLVLAERRGIPWNKLRGSVQNDITLEEVVRSGPEYIPPKDCFRIQCDNIEFIRQNVPLWNFVTYNGYNLREFGTSGVTEMAVALANAIGTLEEMLRRGHEVDWIAERLAFFWSPASDFFEEVARIRAVRRLWYKIMKYRFDTQSPRSMWMRCHVQTSGVSLMREEPLNNIIRAAYHALACVLGGVQSLHVDSYDEAYSVPTEEAALLSLRTQQIIQAETGVTEVVDPLGGSFYVEALTNEIEMRILDEVDEIERIGGYVTALEKGWLHKKIAEYFNNERKMIEKGVIKLVGYNFYKAPVELPPINVFRYPEGVEEKQKARLGKLREKRDIEKVNSALLALEEACKKGENVMPYTLQCARVGCSEGEIFKVFKQAFGLWKPPVFW
ncbi:MAG: methylmalonyl-CoA mutase [Deltaproteobacteria bacterium]|nr:methylmalonyl-CoA mutase [Deltaproteobacteria bacterium]